jgi:uncharacterized protein YutE (UPF0331/DUF86 family)
MIMGRVEDKKEDIELFISELVEVMPNSYEEYSVSIEKRLACERAFEKIIEATNDLAILFIKEHRLPLPSEDEKAFDILAKSKLIQEELALKLKQAKGMRNVLAHQYDNIDDEIIFEAIHDEIIKDVEEFLEEMG